MLDHVLYDWGLGCEEKESMKFLVISSVISCIFLVFRYFLMSSFGTNQGDEVILRRALDWTISRSLYEVGGSISLK